MDMWDFNLTIPLPAAVLAADGKYHLKMWCALTSEDTCSLLVFNSILQVLLNEYIHTHWEYFLFTECVDGAPIIAGISHVPVSGLWLNLHYRCHWWYHWGLQTIAPRVITSESDSMDLFFHSTANKMAVFLTFYMSYGLKAIWVKASLVLWFVAFGWLWVEC